MEPLLRYVKGESKRGEGALTGLEPVFVTISVLFVMVVNLVSGMVGGENVSQIVVSLLQNSLLTGVAERLREWRPQFACSLQLWDTPVDQSHHLQL